MNDTEIEIISNCANLDEVDQVLKGFLKIVSVFLTANVIKTN